MARILEIQKKSNEWMAQFGANVTRVLKSNGKDMVNLNRSQMISSLTATDKPLIHRSTGSSKLTRQYARRTGKTTPDLFLSGAFQDAMNIEIPNEKEYFIKSSDKKSVWLEDNYGKIFGVAPSNQPKANAINDPAIINDYINKVFR